MCPGWAQQKRRLTTSRHAHREEWAPTRKPLHIGKSGVATNQVLAQHARKGRQGRT